MRSKLFFIALTIISLCTIYSQSNSQSIMCSTQMPDSALNVATTCLDTARYFQTIPGETLSVKIKFHVIRRSDGSRLHPLTYTLLSDSLFNRMRTVYLNTNILINLILDSTINYIDNSDFYNGIQNFYVSVMDISARYDSAGHVNFYFLPDGTAEAFYGVGTEYGSIRIGDSKLYDSYTGDTTAIILIHELGHVFGLLHSFESIKGTEKITRQLSTRNCYSAGDFCCDTPAHPGRGNDDYLYQAYTDLCTVDTSLSHHVDPTGLRYVTQPVPLQPNIRNYMTYAQTHCRDHFTQEQGMIMRCHVSNWGSNNIKQQYVINKSSTIDNLGDSLFVFLNRRRYGGQSDRAILIESGGYFFTKPGALDNDTDRTTLKTLDTLNYSNGNWKNYSWNDDLTRTNVTTYFAYNDSILPQSNWNLTSAYFKRGYKDVKLLSQVDDITVDSLPFKFFDPWKATYSQTSSSRLMRFPPSRQDTSFKSWKTPFTPVGGALLDMEYNSSFSRRNSFYKARASRGLRPGFGGSWTEYNPDVTSFNAGGFVFLGWDTTQANTFYADTTIQPWNQRAIVFRDSNQTIKIKYESYLATSDLYPFSTNSQRHLCTDGNKHYLAYTLNSVVYITEKDSTVSGTWTSKKILDFGFTGSYSLDANDGRVFLVMTGNTNWKLLEYNPATGATSDTSAFTNGTFNNPVIALQKRTSAGDTLLVSVAESPEATNGLAISVKKRDKFNVYPTLKTTSFTQAAAGSTNPALVCDHDGNFHLAWQELRTIYYQKFSIDNNGNVTPASSTKETVTNCAAMKDGEKPSITVDKDQHPIITYITRFYDVNTNHWSGNPQSPYKNAVAVVKKFGSSSSTWGHEWLFAIKKRTSYDPVIGGNKEGSDKINAVWWSTFSGAQRKMHSVVGVPQPGASPKTHWTVKTFSDSGYTPIVSLSTAAAPFVAYVKDSTTLGSTKFRFLGWTSNASLLGYYSVSPDSVIEMRGVLLSGSTFNNGVAMTVFEDSLTEQDQPFVAMSDTTTLASVANIKDLVKTETFVASKVKLAVYRTAYGISDPNTASIFNTNTIEWFAEVRNAINDSLILSQRIARLAINESMPGIDSFFVSFVRQPVYVVMAAEYPPSIIDCRDLLQFYHEHTEMPWYSPLKYSPHYKTNILEKSYFSLEQNHPNPFNPTTEIVYHVFGNEENNLSLKIYDTFGREIKTLADGKHKSGRYSVKFNGSLLPSGLYIYTLTGEGTKITKSMSLVK